MPRSMLLSLTLAMCFIGSWAVGKEPTAAGPYPPATEFERPRMNSMAPDRRPFQYRQQESIPFYEAEGSRTGEGKWDRMQLPLEPLESKKHLVVPEGFRVELFAAEPDIGKPICMNWDERGRLWIAETVDYPNELQPEGEGRDRIRICEDTDGDGRADTFTVFAQQLSIPTSLTFARGGVIVHQAPHTLFLRDTDGDDRADEREVLFTGWNTHDTHAGPSNLQYGLDNWIWGMQGYAGFEGTVGGEQHRFSMGFYRFRPDGAKLEFIRSTNNNTWGLSFSEEGFVFGSTANRNPSVYMPIANRYYERVRGWSARQLGGIADTHLFQPITDKVRQVDHHGGYTAAAGHAIYTARTYPQPFWNRTAFVCGPTGHLVGTFVLEQQGADFRSRSPFNLLASDDEWTAPIMAEVGPDGNVWVADWYNYIVQHNPTPVGFETGKGNAYESPLRDKQRGRIYRVVYEAAEASEPPQLHNATPQQLVDALRHDNMLWRRHAQRLLVERGRQDVVPQLIQLVRNPAVDEIGQNPAAIHALWTLHGLAALDASDSPAAEAARDALSHPAAGVRRNALQVLPGDARSRQAILEAELLQDPNAQVRLAALLALSGMPADESAGRAVGAMLVQPENLHDRWIPDAAASAAAAHALPVLRSLAGRYSASGEQPPVRLQEVIGTVAEHYARGGPRQKLPELFAALAMSHSAYSGVVVDRLARGWPDGTRPVVDARLEDAVAALLPSLPLGAKGQLIKLVSGWGSERFEKYAAEIIRSLIEKIQDEQLEDVERAAAASELVALRSFDGEVVAQLLDVVSPRMSPQLANDMLEALSASRSARGGEVLAERLAQLSPSTRVAGLRVLIRRPEWTEALLDAVERGEANISDLSLDQRQALAAHPDRLLARRAQRLLEQGGGLPSPDRQQVLEQLAPLAQQHGDAGHGKEVFNKYCAKCHTHSGEGTRIGPDLTGMAVHPKMELLTHILDPSRSVEGNYRVYTVVTADGRVLNGLLASETRTTIELFDSEGKQHVVLREDIDELVASPKSLMPDGFEKQATHRELVDLLEFLTQRGRFMPLDISKVATAVSTQGMFWNREAQVERLVFDDWSLKTVQNVPFQLIDPQGARVPNAVLLFGPQGTYPPRMPKTVTLDCNMPVRAVHLLSGVSGWGYPLGEKGSVSLIVRLRYADGVIEEHPLRNGVHFADYIRRIDVPESEHAFTLGGQQLRYLSLQPKRSEPVGVIDLVKGPDATAPVVMAVTVETAQ